MNTGDKLEIFQAFYAFLVSNNSLENYIVNIKNDLYDDTNYKTECLIQNAFRWSSTPEKSRYWGILDVDWKKLDNSTYRFTCQEIHDFLLNTPSLQKYEYW